MVTRFDDHGLGWVPDSPDPRDYTHEHQAIAKVLEAKCYLKHEDGCELPTKCDLADWLPPAFSQGSWNACTANACVALVEFFEKRFAGKSTDASRSFLYKRTREIQGVQGNAPVSFRNAMKALQSYGVPPEELWPYDPSHIDAEPPESVSRSAEQYKTVRYFRVDRGTPSPERMLRRIKACLAAEIPTVFGLHLYYSARVQSYMNNGSFPLPSASDTPNGGHGLAAVGYDDSIVVHNTEKGGPETCGALRVRNSWGRGWGEKGYGWLPYAYVTERTDLTADWWCIVDQKWVDQPELASNAPSESVTTQDKKED